MISLLDKQEIILMYIREKKSQREISRETGISRDTIKKYIDEYEAKLVEIGKISKGDDIRKIDLIDEITSKPKYKSTPRYKKALTDEVVERIKFYLKENENKRLKGMSKQQKKKKDIHEALIDEGFDISYPSVVNAINSIERRAKEAYIRQEYCLGDVTEFDWGTVKLYTEGGILREYQLAVFTSAYGNYRWARIFPKQNTLCFLEAHALYFEHIGGAYKTVVYDNTKVAVKKFVGHSEREATEALLKLSLYYKFRFRFCNAYRGNEKGHVERSVDVVRRKAFSHRDIFNSIEEANEYLMNVLDKVNNLQQAQYGNRTAVDMFEEEKEHLLPKMPMYETARVEDFRVDKYSTVNIDSCHYSVPDNYVNTIVRCKIYSSRILIFYNTEKIAEHIKHPGFNQWIISIEHYIKTLFRKPKALINSSALKQMDLRVKEIYENYFVGKEREFIKLIELIGAYGIISIEKSIDRLMTISPNSVSIDKIEFLCSKKEDDNVTYLNDNNSEILRNSVDMLNSFNELLN